jgi:hypothetical protein
MGSIAVLNTSDGASYGYRLVRIAGSIEGVPATRTLQLRQVSDGSQPLEMAFEVKDGHFKAFTLLGKGANTVRLESAGLTTTLRMTYDPRLLDRHHVVRLCYIRGRDEDGCYAAPCGSPNTEEAAAQRLRLLGHMMQCFTAEMLAAAGLGRQTFALKPDKDAPLEPAVDIHVSKLTRAEISALGNNWSDGGQAGWAYFARELSTYPNRSRAIDVAVLASSHRAEPGCSPVPDHGFLAHTALGGGPLAFFGSGAMSTWAPTLADMESCFHDQRRCAEFPEIHDDSCGRGALWAAYATTAGAVLHELGHCFGLPHTPAGIMARGFDNFNRYFCVSEPGVEGAITLQDEGGAIWHPDSLHTLAASPFILVPGKRAGALSRLLQFLADVVS